MPSHHLSDSQADGETPWPEHFGAWIKIAVVYQKGIRELNRRLKPLAVTVPQFDALANLYVANDLSQNELAHRLLVTKGSVTGLVNRLTDLGLAERNADPDDGRANRVRLTAKGKRVAAKALKVQREMVNQMMEAIPMRDRESLHRIMTRLTDSLPT